MIATVNKQTIQNIPRSYVVRVYAAPSERHPNQYPILYNSNTTHPRATIEFLAMVARKHAINAQDVHFGHCHDLELSWKSYNKLQ
jgi:hypothetical protein